MTEAAFKRIALIFPMLSASNEGEVLNAVRAISKVLADHDLHWNDVAARLRNGAAEDPPHRTKPFERPKPPPPPQPEQPRRQKSAWAYDKEDVLKAFPHRHDIDDWTSEFLDSIHDQVVHQGRSLTEKQRSKLNEILDRLDL